MRFIMCYTLFSILSKFISITRVKKHSGRMKARLMLQVKTTVKKILIKNKK